jgi:uncharacterized protein
MPKAKIEFQDLLFSEEEGFVRVMFLKQFYFDLDRVAMEKIGVKKIWQNFLEFGTGIGSDEARGRLNRLIDIGFQSLKSNLGRDAVYVHKNSGIPLVGSNYFGIIDRNNSLIEIRPITGCNLSCIYCSVDEGKGGRKNADYVVEKDYLLDELKRMAFAKRPTEIKGWDDSSKIGRWIEVHINAQGEPLLYSPMIELVRGIKEIPEIKKISLDTNGTLLSKRLAEELASAGLDQINLSLNAVDKDKASRIAGCNYNISGIIEAATHAQKKGIKIVLAPVWLPGINDDDIEALVVMAKENNGGIGIQNFLRYNAGRNPVKQAKMEDFFAWLAELEKKHGIKLLLGPEDFDIVAAKPLEKPFKKGQSVIARLVCIGRADNEVLGAFQGRLIHVFGWHGKGKAIGSTIKVKITRDKHNIFYGCAVR